MKVSVKKWGNSASVRIPAPIMQAAHLKLDQSVDMREEEGRIIIEPLSRKKSPRVETGAALIAAMQACPYEIDIESPREYSPVRDADF